MLDLFCDAKMMVLLVNFSMVRQSVVQVAIFVISIIIINYNNIYICPTDTGTFGSNVEESVPNNSW